MSAAKQPLVSNVRHAYALAALSGFLYFLAFPGIDIWPLSFVALVPLIIALRGQSAKRGAGLGWMAGFSMTVFGFYWMIDMLQAFGHFSWLVALVCMLVVCAYQAGRIALLGWFTARAESRGWPFLPAFAIGFAASEFLFPLLFPWYYGATVHQVTSLIQIVEFGNPIVLGLVLVAANFAIAEFVTAKLEHERPRYRLALTLGAIPLLAAAYGAVRIRQVDLQVAKAPKSRVAIVQANMSLAGKRENVMEGIARHVHLTQELRDSGGVDLAVWSETSDMRAVDEDIANSFYPSEFTRELGLPTIFGAILQRPVPDAREHGLLNTALVSDSSGKIIARYDKHSLLAFGEYMPFGDYVPALYGWLPQAGHYIPGTSLEPLKVIGHRIAVCICYEDIIPSFVNRMMRHTAPDLLVNMTNDAWFGDTTAPWIHVALAKFRAVEHRRYLVRATNSGVSAFVDPVGRITSHSSTFKQQYLKDDVAWITTTTPYELYGDVPWWLASVLAVGMSLLRRPERRRIANTAPEPVLDTAR